jgi:hypothetical protein
LQIEIALIVDLKAHQFTVGLCFVRAIFSGNSSDAVARSAI